jgi:DNA polymerase-3 subunit delta'
VALETIPGQPRVQAVLERALAAGRVAHAYAFVGPPGSGRAGAARAFARALLCPAGGCGQCRACTLLAHDHHPDYHVLAPTPPETNPRGARAIRLGAIRELERRAALAPVRGVRKVFVLQDAETMTGEAPQAFLKTLEEPPARTVIILIVARLRALPATVWSRCQVVRFQPRPTPEDPQERAAVRAALAEVRARGAEALFRHGQAWERDREGAERFVQACGRHCRDLLLLRCGAPAHLLYAPDRAEELRGEAEAWTEEALVRALAVCREAHRALAVNVSPRLTVEVVLARLALPAA